MIRDDTYRISAGAASRYAKPLGLASLDMVVRGALAPGVCIPVIHEESKPQGLKAHSVAELERAKPKGLAYLDANFASNLICIGSVKVICAKDVNHAR